MRIDELEIGVGFGGWVEVRSDDPVLDVYLRFAEVEGKLEMVDLFIAPGERVRVTADVLRQLSSIVRQLEAVANAPDWADTIRRRLPFPAPDLRTAASHFATTFFKKEPDHWVKLMFESQYDAFDGPTPKVAKPRAKGMNLPAPSAKLPTPSRTGRDYGDAFYKSVANVYSSLAAHTHKPADLMADANEIAVTTVHRWVKEARRRGFLPKSPGKGRIG